MAGDERTTIAVRGLGKRFGSFQAVDDLSFSAYRGEVFGLLGPNGAGKTTTIRMLTGLLRPTSGSATIAGYDVVQQPVEVKRRISYLADGPFLYPKLTGWEFLEFIADVYGLEQRLWQHKAGELLSLFDLADRSRDLIEAYSHGMRQKLAFAAALLHDPDVLFLDEPTSGLDPKSARIIKDLLAGLSERGRTIVFSTHILEIAQALCHRVAIVNHGRLIALGTLDELRGRTAPPAPTLSTNGGPPPYGQVPGPDVARPTVTESSTWARPGSVDNAAWSRPGPSASGDRAPAEHTAGPAAAVPLGPQSSLEDIFLRLTGGPEAEALAAVLGEPR